MQTRHLWIEGWLPTLRTLAGSRWVTFTLLVAAGVCSVLLHGFEFPYNNNVFHVPIALGVFDSAEGPHDAFHRSLGNFVSAFWLLVRMCVTENSIREVFLVLHVATRIATMTILWLIVRQMVGPRPAALIALSLPFFIGLLGSMSPLGHHEVFVNYLTHSEVVTVFVLLAWLLQLKHRWIWAAAVLGFGFNINAFVAVWAAVAGWLAMMFVERDRSSAARLRKTCEMVFACVVAAAPTVVWIVKSQLTAPDTSVTYDFREFLLNYFPYHTFIHVQAQSVGCFAAFAGIASLLVADSWTGADKRTAKFWTGTIVGLLVVVLFGMALPYVTSSRLLLNLYPLRMDAFVLFAGLILLCTRLVKQSGSASEPWLLLVGLFSFTSGNLWLLFVTVAFALQPTAGHRRIWSLLFWGTLAIFFLNGIAFHEATMLRPIRANEVAIATLTTGAVAGFALRERHWSTPLLPMIVVAMGIGTGAGNAAVMIAAYLVVACTHIWMTADDNTFANRILWGANCATLCALALTATGIQSPILVAVGAMFIAYLAPRIVQAVPWFKLGPAVVPALYVVVVSLAVVLATILRGTVSRAGNERTTAFIEVAKWARHNTPADTLFLTPHETDGFFMHSRRPAWVEWKAGAATMWQPSYYPEWSTRSKEVMPLRRSREWLAYAQLHGIPYVLLDLAAESERNVSVLTFAVRNQYFGIVRTGDQSPLLLRAATK